MERVVEVEVPVTVVMEVDVEVLPRGPTWAMALTHLAEQLDRGLIYDRDLADLVAVAGSSYRSAEPTAMVAGASRHLTSHSALHRRSCPRP